MRTSPQGPAAKAELKEKSRDDTALCHIEVVRKKTLTGRITPTGHRNRNSEIEMNSQASRPETTAIVWSRDPEFPSPSHAEHAHVGRYELVAFDLPATDREPWIIGWELFGGPDLQTLLDKGVGATFGDAKTAAEAALKKQLSQPGPH